MRRSAASRSGTIFWLPTTRISAPKAARIRSHLTASRGHPDELARLGQRLNGVEHDVGRRGPLSDLAGLRLPVPVALALAEKVSASGSVRRCTDARRER